MHKNKIFILSVLSASLVLSGCDNTETLSSIFESAVIIGDGSEENPFKISNKLQLVNFAKLVKESDSISENTYFELTSDIDFNGNEWVPVGTIEKPFTGYFLGNGYSIKNIKITEVPEEPSEYSCYGFFGYTHSAAIKEVTLENLTLDIDVFGTETIVYAGGLVGYGTNTYIDQVHVDLEKFTITSLQNGNSGIYVGGIGGFLTSEADEQQMYYVDITNSSVVGNLFLNMKNSADTLSYAGGLAGTIYTGYLTGIYAVNNCFFNGNVTSGTYSAGIVAYLGSLGSVVDSYAYGDFIKSTDTGGAYAAGLVAYAASETAILNSYAGYNSITAPESTDYYKSYAGAISAVYATDGYDSDSSIRGLAMYNCYVKTDVELSANNIVSGTEITIDNSFFKNTLKYTDKIWDLSAQYPIHKKDIEAYKADVTLDLNYETNENNTIMNIDAGNYNADLALAVTTADLKRDNYSFYGYHYDKEGKVSFRWYAPINSHITIYAAWAELNSLIGTYDYECLYYGEIVGKGKWKFDEDYFYWQSPDHSILKYTYYFDGKYIFIGDGIVGPMGIFLGANEGSIFTFENNVITGYDTNSYDAVYIGEKSNEELIVPNFENKPFLGDWYSSKAKITLYSDGNASGVKYGSEVDYYGGFYEDNNELILEIWSIISKTSFKYDASNDVMVANGSILTRKPIIVQYATSDNSLVISVTEEKTYVIANGVLSSDIVNGTLADGETIKIGAVEYVISDNTLVLASDYTIDVTPILGGWKTDTDGDYGASDAIVNVIVTANGTAIVNVEGATSSSLSNVSFTLSNLKAGVYTFTNDTYGELKIDASYVEEIEPFVYITYEQGGLNGDVEYFYFNPDANPQIPAYCGTWEGKIGLNNWTIIINSDGTLSFNGNSAIEYTVNGNIITAGSLTCTYNPSNESLYVVYEDEEIWDGTMTTFTPESLSASFDASSVVGVYAGTISSNFGSSSCTLNLNADGTGNLLNTENLEYMTFTWSLDENGNLVFSNIEYHATAGYDDFSIISFDAKEGTIEANIVYDYMTDCPISLTKTA